MKPDDQAGPGCGIPLEFPCQYPLKVFGANNPEFAALVAEIVARHVAGDDLRGTESRASGGGRYLAVTMILNARSRAQLDALYRELTGHPDVLMCL